MRTMWLGVLPLLVPHCGTVTIPDVGNVGSLEMSSSVGGVISIDNAASIYPPFIVQQRKAKTHVKGLEFEHAAAPELS